MTVDVSTNGRACIDEALRALYLLPSAPRELIDAVYAALSNGGGASRELRAAYETVVATPDALSNGYRPPLRTSPWELLRLRPDAPQCVIAAAYDLWRGDEEPLVIRAPVIEMFAESSPLPKGEGPGVRAGNEELPDAPEEIERQPNAYEPSSPPRVGACPEPGRREGPGVRAGNEELPGDTEEIERQPNAYEPSSPPRVGACPEPGRREGPGVRAGNEELPDAPEEIEQHSEDARPLPGETSPPRVREGPGEGSDYFVSAYEELDEQPSSPPRHREGPDEGSAPTLVAPGGTILALGDRPLRIGTQPSCEFVLRADARVEARVWRNKGRVLAHALGEPGLVLVNGQSATWAVLTDGDTLAVGPVSFSFHAPKTT